MSDKLVNIITCDNMKADVVLLADGKITVMEFSQMHKKIEELEASNAELLEALKTCCIATQGTEKAFCECMQHYSRPCLDMEGICWFGKNGNCHIWKAIQKAIGQKTLKK